MGWGIEWVGLEWGIDWVEGRKGFKFKKKLYVYKRRIYVLFIIVKVSK